MHVPVDSQVLVLAMDGRIWVDGESMIAYLRSVEKIAQDHVEQAKRDDDSARAVAAFASGDIIRQIADSLVLTTMHAGETVRSRHESRR